MADQQVFQACIVKVDDEGKKTDILVMPKSFMAESEKAAINQIRHDHYNDIKDAGGPSKVEVLIRPFCGRGEEANT